jgi:hypothetical protein
MCSERNSAGGPCADSRDCRLGTECEVSSVTRTRLCIPSGGTCSCVGDCNCDGQVTVDEIITMVNIGLGAVDPARCLTGDANGDGQITVDEIITAVTNALNGCAAAS